MRICLERKYLLRWRHTVVRGTARPWRWQAYHSHRQHNQHKRIDFAPCLLPVAFSMLHCWLPCVSTEPCSSHHPPSTNAYGTSSARKRHSATQNGLLVIYLLDCTRATNNTCNSTLTDLSPCSIFNSFETIETHLQLVLLLKRSF